MNKDLPSDYEACGTCGYDHAYEHGEAHYAHRTNVTKDTAEAMKATPHVVKLAQGLIAHASDDDPMLPVYVEEFKQLEPTDRVACWSLLVGGDGLAKLDELKCLHKHLFTSILDVFGIPHSYRF